MEEKIRIERDSLNTELVGKEIIYAEELESTQEYVKQQKEELADGTVVIANRQTKGKGTKGRTWYMQSSENIAMTILIKPNCEISKLEGFTKQLAEIIRTVIYDLYGYSLEVKEPNDLLLNGKKIAGILTESITREQKVSYLIIGIGFNVNEIHFPEEIIDIATSLKKEFQKDFSKESIISKIILELEKNIKILYNDSELN